MGLLFLLWVPIIQGQSAHVIHNDLNSTKWTNSTLNLVHDSSSYFLESSAGEYEDFTEYTESDSLNRLTQSEIRSTFTDINRVDENVFLYETYTGELQTFTYYLRFYLDSTTSLAIQSRLNIFMVTERLDDWSDSRLANYELFGIHLTSHTDNNFYTLHLIESYNSAVQISPSVAINDHLEINKIYYLKLTKSGTLLTLNVYTDAEMTDEEYDYIGGVSMTLNGDWNLPYLMIPQSMGLSGNVASTGYVEYVSTQLMEYSDGYLITDDLMVNATGPAHALIYNFSLNSQGFNVSYSQDLTNWTMLSDYSVEPPNGEGVSYLESLNVTKPLYFKFGFETDKADTPILYDYHLTFYTDTGDDDGLTFGDLNWMLAVIWLVLLMTGWIGRISPLKVIGGVFGMVVGIYFLTEDTLVGLIIVFFSLILFVLSARENS